MLILHMFERVVNFGNIGQDDYFDVLYGLASQSVSQRLFAHIAVSGGSVPAAASRADQCKPLNCDLY